MEHCDTIVVMRTLPKPLAQGQAGVYAVASQLLLRGITPCFPSVDIGTDIITIAGTKLQVKSCHAHIHPKWYGGFQFYPFTFGKHVKLSKGQRIENYHIFSEICDFVVLWGIEQSRYWIVPAHLLDGKSGCTLGPESAFCAADIEIVKQARKAGMTYRAISAKHNLSLATTHRLDNSDYEANFSSKVREYENHWDLISSYEGTLQEAENIISARRDEDLIEDLSKEKM
jgi:hypothetical protein